jgi:RHS repeat-associated protein
MRGIGGSSGRWLARWMACCVTGLVGCAAGLVGSPAVALAQGSSPGSPGGGSGASSSSLATPLVVPGGLEEGQQAQAAEEARRSSPEAVTARERSRTAFEGLSTPAAAKLAGEAFPGVIDRRAGSLPALPAGQRVVGYPADNAAQIALPGGKHGVIESMEPLALETSRGHREPLDLGLTEAGGAFQPARSGVAVHIPKRLADGVQLPSTGVSLTPVGTNGSALGGAKGALDGATVVYANTQTDSDTVVKPLTSGFEEDTLLRSVDSPSRLSFRVGLPADARLLPAKHGLGGVDVVDQGAVIAAVPAPSAQDAEGTVVPVSMSVSGDILTLSVDDRSGSYRYPIAVDPTVVENGGYEHEILYGGTWGFFTENSSIFKASQLEKENGMRYVEDVVSKSVKAGERAFFYYPTQGESRIYEVAAHTNFAGYAGSKMEDVLGIENVHTGKTEASQSWVENYGAESTLCSESGCASGTVSSSNDKSEVFYQQDARESNELAGGTASLYSATVDIVQEAKPSASFTPINKWVKTIAPNRTWLSLVASDPGLGVSSSEWSSPSSSEWKPDTYVGGCSGVQCEECYGTTGCGKPAITGDLEGLPEGEDVVKSTTKDPVGLSVAAETTVKIDNQAPHNLTLTGFPADHEISFGRYVVKVSGTDGSGSTPSSGVASIALAIDGKEVGTPRGACSPGPCTGTGEWVIDGEEYAAGKHTFTMTATDGAGNVAKEEFPLTIESSESKGVGPGSVNLTSGAFTLNATDVSIAAAGGGLSVQRSYNSRHLTAGAEGPLGPQWSGLGMGGTQSLAKLPTGSMLLTAANGAQSVFAKEGTKFVSPTGDLNLTLKETEANVFTLTEQNGTVTTFTLPSSGSGALFTPHIREAPGVAGTVKYTYQTVSGITKPTQALAPVPAGVSCTTLVKGCRALTFEYAKETTAKGEAESEWGEYKGRLMRVFFTAWEPSKAEMTTTAVAQYSYDKAGRLRAAWNPLVSPALKTTYGYDSEGHVTALTGPGQETWAFTYMSIASDPNTGRLLKAMQAPASTALWNGQAIANTEAPKLSGTAMVGNRMGVSNGAWSNGPVTYGYQWERCSSSGGECAPIAGAANPNYTPVEADAGHTLTATVTAVNGDGSVVATSAVSGLVSASGAPLYVSSTPGKSQSSYKAPADVAVSSATRSKGDVWVLDTGHDQLVEFSEGGEFLRRVGSKGTGNGQLSEPKSIAVDSKGNVWVADTGNDRIEEFNEKGEYQKQFTTKGTNVNPKGIALDSSGNVWVTTESLSEKGLGADVQEFNEKGEYIQEFGSEGTGNGQFSDPSGIAVNEKHVWVADTGNNRVQELGEKGEFIQKFGSKGEGNAQFSEPEGIVVTAKHVWVADTKNNRVEELGEKGEYQQAVGSKGEGNGQLKSPEGVAIDSKGNVWVADTANNRIEEFSEKGAYQRQFDNQGTTPGEMESPSGVAIEPTGGVRVASRWEDNIRSFEENGQYLGKFGSAGSGSGQFSEPTDIAINSKYEMWVVDTGNQRVERFNEYDQYVSAFGSRGTGNGQFEFPRGIAIDSKGNIWVTDQYNDRIEEFNEKGEFERTVGSAGTGNGQFYGPAGVAVDSKGDVWVADTGNNRVQELGEKGEFIKAFGSAGKGNGQFEIPVGIAIDSSGNVWVVDTENDRVEEFNEKGEYQTSFGSKGEGPGLFKFETWSYLAIDSKGNLWVTDSGNEREQHWQVISKVESAEALAPAPGSTVEYGVGLSGSGAPYTMSSTELEKWGQKDDPSEATAIFPPDEPQSTPAGDYRRATVYYLDNHGRTVNAASPGGAISTSEYNATDDVVRTLSPDNRVAALKEGTKSSEVSKLLDTQSTYNGEGAELQSTLGPQHTVKLASGTTVEARDHQQYNYDEGAPSEGGPYRLVTKVSDGAQYSGKEEDVRTTTTSYSGQENLGWKLRKPTSVTTDPSGLKLTHTIVYEAATGNLIETTTPAGSAENPPPAYALTFGSKGNGNGQLSHPDDVAVDSSANVWVTDTWNNRLEKFSSTGTFVASYGELGSSETKLQFNEPVGIAINSKTGNIYVGDKNNNRVVELSSSGALVRMFGKKGTGTGEFQEPNGVAIGAKGYVYVTDYKNNRVEVFNEEGKYVSEFGIKGSEKGQLNGPGGIAIAGEQTIYVTDENNSRVDEFSEEGKKALGSFGSGGSGNGQFKYPTGVAIGSSGNVYVADGGNARVQEFSSTGSFLTSFGTKGSGNGQMLEPEGVAVLSSGVIYVTDAGANDRVQEWVSSKGAAHTTQTIYYTTAKNTTVPACGEHPEWANLPCQTQPAKQPETSGLPNLPVTTYTYNIWDEPLTTTEAVGSTTRTKTAAYDAAGRLKTSAISSTVGTALPTVTDEYSSETGALVKQCTNEGKPCSEGKPKTITNVYNTLGELTSYTDADENTATYNYDIDGRIEKANDGKGTQTYTYDPTTGFTTKLVDSAAGTFTGSYDIGGALITEGYPNGMNANYAYNQIGKPTGLEYVKMTHCTEKCTWFSDSVVPSIHGQWLEQTSTLSKQSYTYDAAGRLTQTQNTPAGKGCTTRVYAYEEDTNRTSLTTREPGTKGECTSTGGTVESHSYDPADRLTDTGAAYSTFGNITTLPPADAGGSELTSAYYTDNQLQSETQNGQTIGYNLDPTGRTREVVSTGKKISDVINHYAGPGNTPAWTVNTSGEWTRNIAGISGFAAVQNNAETPVLQLTNLHGDVIATAYLSETATALASTADTSEFGVPTTSLPPKYSWLGANEIPTELPSGVLDMGARSYVPQLGRFLQPDPRSGGSANAYTYTFGDPVNASDPSGEYTLGGPSEALINGTAQMASEAAAEQAAINAAARAEAERKAQAAAAALAAAGPQYEEEGEEYEEEEGGYEYASYHHGAMPGSEEGHVEMAVLVQPLGGEESEGNGENAGGVFHFASHHKKSGKKLHGGLVPHCSAGASYNILSKKCESPTTEPCGSASSYTCEELVERYHQQEERQHEETKEWVDIGKCVAADGACPGG